jgi:hypothetical protein
MTDSEEEKQDIFEEHFFRDLETFFSADLACCDSCYNDFLAKWPIVYLRDVEFQFISLQDFYSGSRLQEFYSIDEFWTMVRQIECPRCHKYLSYNLYPYNFPFTPPHDFEKTLLEITELVIQTPYLVLTHPMAIKTYEGIDNLSKATTSTQVKTSLFRGRRKGIDITKVEEFGPPPVYKAKEGRYNHIGKPVIYLASNKPTCFNEMKCPPEGIIIAEYHSMIVLKYLILHNFLKLMKVFFRQWFGLHY